MMQNNIELTRAFWLISLLALGLQVYRVEAKPPGLFHSFTEMDYNYSDEGDGLSSSSFSIAAAQRLVEKYAKEIQTSILNDDTYYADPQDREVFASTFKMALTEAISNTFQYKSSQAGSYQKSETFVLTGGWQCYGPSWTTDADKQPYGTMGEMWIRDAAAQVHSYVVMLKEIGLKATGPKDILCTKEECRSMGDVIEGFIRTASEDLRKAAYAHAFVKKENGEDGIVNETGRSYEADSAAYLIWVVQEYHKVLEMYKDRFGDDAQDGFLSSPTMVITPQFTEVLMVIIDMYIRGQSELFQYTSIDSSPGDRLEVESIFLCDPIEKKNCIGLTATHQLPSDDLSVLPYEIPNNLLIALVLGRVEDMPLADSRTCSSEEVKTKAKRLKQEIQGGIEKYAVLNHYKYGKIYAFCTDGLIDEASFQQRDGRVSDNGYEYELPFSPFHVSSGAGQSTSLGKPELSLEVILYSSPGTLQKVLIPLDDFKIQEGNKLVLLNHVGNLNASQLLTVRGNFVLFDDANLPNLLGAPYFDPQFAVLSTDIYSNSRRFSLSTDNPFYFVGKDSSSGVSYEGLGSGHIEEYAHKHKYIWPLGLTAQGMTSFWGYGSPDEVNRKVKQLVSSSQSDTNPGAFYCEDQFLRRRYPTKGLLKEAFSADDASSYTRGYFAWPSQFFSEFVIELYSPFSHRGHEALSEGQVE
eukprot:Nk52_evm9s234 gene=Nk52_evmTU9s234